MTEANAVVAEISVHPTSAKRTFLHSATEALPKGGKITDPVKTKIDKMKKRIDRVLEVT
jgi:hypothetical protein